MTVYASGEWLIDVAAITPSVVTRAPIGQATVRILLTHGCVAESMDLPAKAALVLATALVECAEKSREHFVAAYGDCAT